MPEVIAYVQDGDRLSANIPKTILNGWERWKQAHPDKITRIYGERSQGCKWCEGSGFIIGIRRHRETDRRYTFAFRCTRCKNNQDHSITAAAEIDYDRQPPFF